MANSESFCGRFSNCLLGVLRIVIGLLFMQHGGQKLLNYPPGFGTVPLHSLMGLAGILELAGGALILVGFLTRPVAFILSGEMAVAYFIAYEPLGAVLLWRLVSDCVPSLNVVRRTRVFVMRP